MVTVGRNGVSATSFDQQTVLTQDFKELIPTEAKIGQMFQELAAANTGHQLTQRSHSGQNLANSISL
jgi:hypothetical protein